MVARGLWFVGLCAVLALSIGCKVLAGVEPTITPPPDTATAAPATATAVPATATVAPATPTTAPGTPTTAPPPPTTAPTVAATPAAAAKPTAAGDARGALGEVFRGWGGVKTFRSRVDVVLAAGAAPQTAMQMEVVLPDRMRGTVNAGGQRLEILMIGGAAYMKLPTGQWMRAPAEIPVDFSALDPKRFESEFQRDVSNVRLIGPEVVDGTPTLAYAYDIAASPAAKTGPAAAKIWVGVADRLPRKLEVVGAGDPGPVTVTYYDYGAPITIEAPPA